MKFSAVFLALALAHSSVLAAPGGFLQSRDDPSTDQTQSSDVKIVQSTTTTGQGQSGQNSQAPCDAANKAYTDASAQLVQLLNKASNGWRVQKQLDKLASAEADAKELYEKTTIHQQDGQQVVPNVADQQALAAKLDALPKNIEDAKPKICLPGACKDIVEAIEGAKNAQAAKNELFKACNIAGPAPADAAAPDATPSETATPTASPSENATPAASPSGTATPVASGPTPQATATPEGVEASKAASHTVVIVGGGTTTTVTPGSQSTTVIEILSN